MIVYVSVNGTDNVFCVISHILQYTQAYEKWNNEVLKIAKERIKAFGAFNVRKIVTQGWLKAVVVWLVCR